MYMHGLGDAISDEIDRQISDGGFGGSTDASTLPPTSNPSWTGVLQTAIAKFSDYQIAKEQADALQAAQSRAGTPVLVRPSAPTPGYSPFPGLSMSGAGGLILPLAIGAGIFFLIRAMK